MSAPISVQPVLTAVVHSQPGEEATEKLLQELREAISARDTFIAVAAHELRNPMMPIKGQVDLLRSGIRQKKLSLEQIDERLTRIQRAVEQYLKRAVVLLDVSRINSGRFLLDPAPCDMAMLLRHIAEEFAAIASHADVKLTVHAPEKVPGVWDRVAVEQVIDNLISNAIKYAGHAPVELHLDVEDSAAVCLRVRDHGKGIPTEHRARIFDRFERAVGNEEHRSGFGVGLWVVGQLVAAMQGSIKIEEAPGGGALFIAKLPLTCTGDTG